MEIALKPEEGLKFSVPIQPGLTLDFVPGPEGRATAIKTPQGELTRDQGDVADMSEASDDGDLTRLTGTYALGPTSVEIKASGDKLTMLQSGMEVELKSEGALKFSVPIQPGLVLEFVLGPDGRATEIRTSAGNLTRTGG